MRFARDMGTVSELYPPGITDIRDMPHPWFSAIRQAMVFLSWEELEKEERPPKAIWLDGDRLNEWFKAVEKRREEKYGGGSKDSPGEIEDPVENEAAKSLVVG